MRVVIYARGTAQQIIEQQEHCRERAEQRRHAIVALAIDQPSTRTGWDSAYIMLMRGEVDLIMVDSRRFIPHIIESVTYDQIRTGRYRQTRIIRRDGAGGF